MKNRYQAALTASLVLASALTLNAAGFFFKDGDKVVMMGDSITEQYLYSRYVEAWTLTRFPAWNITFVNVGISGDRSTGGNSRFARDVIPKSRRTISKPSARRSSRNAWPKCRNTSMRSGRRSSCSPIRWKSSPFQNRRIIV